MTRCTKVRMRPKVVPLPLPDNLHSLQHIRGYQWTPDILTYDSGHMVKSTSYYVQQATFSPHMIAGFPFSNH